VSNGIRRSRSATKEAWRLRLRLERRRLIAQAFGLEPTVEFAEPLLRELPNRCRRLLLLGRAVAGKGDARGFGVAGGDVGQCGAIAFVGDHAEMRHERCGQRGRQLPVLDQEASIDRFASGDRLADAGEYPGAVGGWCLPGLLWREAEGSAVTSAGII
jgi:hypothetical protein